VAVDDRGSAHSLAVMQTLTAIVYPTPDSKCLVAFNPETGTTTQGKTLDAALANLKEATELYLSEFPLRKSGHAVMTTFEVATSHAAGIFTGC
jgi:predicted RNase H-like HicB family nuclease